MANVVASSLELQDATAGYWFSFTRGGLGSIYTVRGADWEIPGKAGLEAGDRVAHSKLVTLHGVVFGVTATPAVSHLAKMGALFTVFDPAADPFSLTVHSGARGVGGRLGVGETATLNVRFLRPVAMIDDDEFWYGDLECECIDSPPEWVVTAS